MEKAICPKCGSDGRITEEPFDVPWISLASDLGKGGRFSVKCSRCGFAALPMDYCGWPTAAGYPITREMARERAIKNFIAGREKPTLTRFEPAAADSSN